MSILYRLMDSDRKGPRLNSSHVEISYAVFCLKKQHSICLLTSTPAPTQLYTLSLHDALPIFVDFYREAHLGWDTLQQVEIIQVQPFGMTVLGVSRNALYDDGNS